jgi:hypothetical protein
MPRARAGHLVSFPESPTFKTGHFPLIQLDFAIPGSGRIIAHIEQQAHHKQAWIQCRASGKILPRPNLRVVVRQ